MSKSKIGKVILLSKKDRSMKGKVQVYFGTCIIYARGY